MNIEVIDNFLPYYQFKSLQQLMLSSDFLWRYIDHIDYSDENTDNFQFVHLFFNDSGVQSYNFVDMYPLLDKLDCCYLLRGKANLNVRGDGNSIGNFHTDIDNITDITDANTVVKTAIFYINTNNGATEFENGEKVGSIENRMVIFDHKIKHRGISCTDEKCRVLINWNFIPTPKENQP